MWTRAILSQTGRKNGLLIVNFNEIIVYNKFGQLIKIQANETTENQSLSRCFLLNGMLSFE